MVSATCLHVTDAAMDATSGHTRRLDAGRDRSLFAMTKEGPPLIWKQTSPA